MSVLVGFMRDYMPQLRSYVPEIEAQSASRPKARIAAISDAPAALAIAKPTDSAARPMGPAAAPIPKLVDPAAKPKDAKSLMARARELLERGVPMSIRAELSMPDFRTLLMGLFCASITTAASYALFTSVADASPFMSTDLTPPFVGATPPPFMSADLTPPFVPPLLPPFAGATPPLLPPFAGATPPLLLPFVGATLPLLPSFAGPMDIGLGRAIALGKHGSSHDLPRKLNPPTSRP